MKKLRHYQKDNAAKGLETLRNLHIVYLAMAVRTGKTVTSMEIAKQYGATNVLFLTKKKAISSINQDYNDFGYSFGITIINNESMHTVDADYDLIISDEHHRNGAFPKPNKITKQIKEKYSKLPMIFLSGTPTPESYSQIYHQFWISDNSPFRQWPIFYKWANAGFIDIKPKYLGYAVVKDYSKLSEIGNVFFETLKRAYFISYTQEEAGFNSTVEENILEVEMMPITYQICDKLKKDNIAKGNSGVILADTGTKLMSKLHQLYSGTVILEDGNALITDRSKALFILDRFKENKIAIFYKFQAEYDLLCQVFGQYITNDLNVFNTTNKNIALQIVSGREGISLAAADYLVYFNIDFSAISYWQSRDRLTTMERPSNQVYWIFSKKGIEHKIYKAVQGKKNYTLSTFKKDNNGLKIPK